MLGTDRLRVVASMWSIIQEYSEGDGTERAASLAAGAADHRRTCRIQGTNWTVQSLYLAAFLRWLGLDSPDSELPGDRTKSAAPAWHAEDFAELRNLLMRDFLAFLPSLNPSVSKADTPNATTRGTKPPAKHKTA